jgi:hypothetical protein
MWGEEKASACNCTRTMGTGPTRDGNWGLSPWQGMRAVTVASTEPEVAE